MSPALSAVEGPVFCRMPYGKGKREHRAFSNFTFNPNFTTVFLNKLFTQNQPQPAALFAGRPSPGAFDINPKQFVYVLLTHPNSCVRNSNFDRVLILMA